ncbi:HAD family phosphatase [uncultured Finegoldia sp.]|uniref:HAD family hydrolase n=1 Tax=uncultured Finegoldia sp. TaxID=328009 RepID=UPI002632EA81|nr:HAD-IB family hydrolase [uncultured Finegoldia sp.]
MTIGAFFDIDGTIARDSLMIEHFKKLINFEIIDQKLYYEKVYPAYQNYEKRKIDYDDYLNELVEVYKYKLKGFSCDFNEFISNQVISQVKEKVYRYTRKMIQYHKENGHLVFFISGSPDFLVKEMANSYGVTEYRASVYVIKNGMYTGEVIPMWDKNSKKTVIDEIIKKYNIDVDNSYCYGDTSGDFSMINMMGKPTAINPTRELFDMIRANEKINDKTKIIIERKDVIYDFPKYGNVLDI